MLGMHVSHTSLDMQALLEWQCETGVERAAEGLDCGGQVKNGARAGDTALRDCMRNGQSVLGGARR